ncbi:MAG: hypothetical protein IJT28_09115 [Bacteroidaceae bacterium]|nr:hypothetical protein [Bacteroidaceae bacterium]MBR6894224.1 hypothetical protein [Bacteroidaceae bacterium]
MAAHYLTRKGDHDDLDDKTTAKPFAEMVSHGNMFYPDPEGKTINPFESVTKHKTE